MTYTINELRLMNDEMLREISLQRYKKSRRSTGDVLRAQKVLWERAGQPFLAVQQIINVIMQRLGLSSNDE